MSCPVCAGHDTYNCPCCSEEVRMIDCPDCNGTGYGDWKVWDIIKREEVSCTETDYRYSARTEDEAIERGQRYCRLSCTCKTCRGEGMIPEDR